MRLLLSLRGLVLDFLSPLFSDGHASEITFHFIAWFEILRICFTVPDTRKGLNYLSHDKILLLRAGALLPRLIDLNDEFSSCLDQAWLACGMLCARPLATAANNGVPVAWVPEKSASSFR